MKVGDKLIPRQDKMFRGAWKNVYTVTAINMDIDEISITTKQQNNPFDWSKNNYYFSSNKGNEFYFGVYFYTDKEYRKLKLEKLNESRR